jgi:hypothetical protein
LPKPTLSILALALNVSLPLPQLDQSDLLAGMVGIAVP